MLKKTDVELLVSGSQKDGEVGEICKGIVETLAKAQCSFNTAQRVVITGEFGISNCFKGEKMWIEAHMLSASVMVIMPKVPTLEELLEKYDIILLEKGDK